MKRLAYAAGALFVVVAALLVIAPALIDTPAVRAEIQRQLAQSLSGQVSWDSLEIAIFPAPHGELRKVRVEIPGRLSAAADELNVYLRLWPLLRGSPQISSVTLVRPQVRIAGTEKGTGSEAPPDAVALYRAAVEPAARALREFAPEMAFRLEQASVEVGADFALRGLRATARTDSKGVELELASAANLWKRLSVEARVEYHDLSARAAVALDALALDKDVPPAALRAKLRTDGKSALECEFDGSIGSLVPAAKGRLRLPAGGPPEVAAELTNVDLAQALAIAKLKGARLDFIESSQGRVSAKGDFVLGPLWLLHLDIVKSDAAVRLAQLPWRLSAHAGRVMVTPERVRIDGVKGSLGDSAFEAVAAQVHFGKAARLSAASGKARLELGQWFPWLQGKLPLEAIASVSGSAEVTLNRLALRFDDPAAADFEAVVAPRKVSAALKALPAPVGVEGGAVHVDRKEVRLQNVAVAMLDARAGVSGSFSLQSSSLELALSEGALGEKIVQWALERGGVPARFEPRTPLRFAAQRIAWSPQGALEADARIDFEGGPALALALAWRPELLELRRLAIKDARSDALFGASVAGDLIYASFSGTLHGHSIPAMLRQPLPVDSGTAQGELRVTIDRAQPRRTSAEGHLRIEALDLAWLAGKKALIERAEIVAERTGVRIPGARFGWEDQFFELRGEGRRTDQGPVVEARIESAGVVLDRLLPPVDKNAPRKKASPIWPLPVSGRVEVRTGFVQYKDYRIEPFDGILSLEPQRARLEVKEARMCGVSFPMEIEAEPEQASAAAHIRMKDEPLERTVRCLTGGNVELTGTADLSAELRTQGRRPHLVRGLTGAVHAEVRQGRVKKFALLGNILSFRGIASFGEMKQDGFPYRAMTAKGRFQDGAFLVEESFFDSDAVRLAAHGRVDLLAANSQLTVLVGLLTRVDRISGAIPIIGEVFGGSMTALPMAVRGDIRNPVIVPLGPRAVTDQLLGIFERTLKLPGKLLVPPEAKTP